MQKKQMDNFKRVTVVFGYVLFAFLLLAVTLSTILPFGSVLLGPAAHHFNIAVLMISLVAGSVLPSLISYLIGDKTTRSKIVIDHHFNGVVFGVSSYWLSMFFFFVGADMISGIRSNFQEPLATIIAGWPVLATLIVMALVAVGYTRTKKSMLAINYRPYQLALLTGFIATLGYVAWNQLFIAHGSWVVSALYIVIPAMLVGCCYAILGSKKDSVPSRLARAAVAASFGFVASSITGQLIPNITISISVAIGVLALALYIVLARRIV